MQNFKEFYILGLPIDTEIGKIKFLKIKEYPDYFMDLQTIGLTKEQIIAKYSAMNNNGSLDELIEEMKTLPLYDIAIGIPELQQSYYSLYIKLFESEAVVSAINRDNFDYYRQLVMTMNCLKEEKINPNPEIQKAIERSKRLKSQDGDSIEFEDMITSIVGYNGLTYDNINDLTIYQMYMTYYRIAHFKNYDTSTLFATVASDKVKIESWSKHIDMFKDESHFVSQEDFQKNTGSLFNE